VSQTTRAACTSQVWFSHSFLDRVLQGVEYASKAMHFTCVSVQFRAPPQSQAFKCSNKIIYPTFIQLDCPRYGMNEKSFAKDAFSNGTLGKAREGAQLGKHWQKHAKTTGSSEDAVKPLRRTFCLPCGCWKALEATRMRLSKSSMMPLS